MIRRLIWFVMGWEGPIPIDSYRGAEHLVAIGGALIFLALYPLWFRVSFAICRRGKYARVGAWTIGAALGLSWYLLALDAFLFNTVLVVFCALFLILAGTITYLVVNRV